MAEISSTGRLAGKVGLISGAAGGIGSAAARAFAAEGAQVGLVDLPTPALQQLSGQLGRAGMALPCDVTSEAQVIRVYAQWAEAYGRADFVYVCAGIQLHDADGPAENLDLAAWNATMAVNLTGAFLFVKHGIESLRRAATGSLIMCGSPTGLTMCGRGYVAYSASKAGMMAIARTVAADYASEGIRANVIVPGTTETLLTEVLTASPATRDTLVAGTPLGRLGSPQDLVGVAVFLASDESRFATGATFAVDGGLTQR